MLSLRAVARRNPNGTALLCNGDVRWSFAKLFDKSEALAFALDLDRHQSRPIAFVANNDPETVALLLALLERNITALPLSPRLTPSEQQDLVGIANAQWIKRSSPAQRHLLARAAGYSPDDSPELRVDGDRTQLLVATSGSTGQPKLVKLSATALEASARASIEHLQLCPRDRWLLCLNLGHIGGLAIILRCLIAEASVVLAEPGMSGEDFSEAIERYGVTLASLVPTQLVRLLDIERPYVPPTLRAALVGGASTPQSLARRARALGWPILLTYGLSEAGSQVTTQPLSDLTRPGSTDAMPAASATPPDDDSSDVGPLGDAGSTVAGVELRLDEHDVIHIRGSTLFDGYLGEADSAVDSEGWFSTGDLGRLTATGRLVPLGRVDDRIVTGGEKVMPIEIEAQILRHPAVAAVTVVGIPDPDWGQIVAAAVVLADSTQTGILESIRCSLQTRLAPFKRPRRWLILPELPQLPNGKLDRRAVAARFTAL